MLRGSAMTAFAHARDRLGPGRFFALLVFVPSAALVLLGPGPWPVAPAAVPWIFWPTSRRWRCGWPCTP